MEQPVFTSTRPVTPAGRRRTFAIISHPDAGKTTLTEKLLLFGGAIQLAGEVKAQAQPRRTRSDWMEIERERGISVVTSVMTFEYGGCVFNLLDTPGHEDFSEDTYRTLTAVDSAVMVIDAAKGIEARTRKLFEVCRLRDIPIITFINKIDREARDPFELLDEIEKTLALDTAPVTWPIGRGRSFAGTYDLARNARAPARCRRGADAGQRPGDPAVEALLPDERREAWREEIELAQRRLPPVRPRGLPRGAPDAGVLRQRAARISASATCSTRWPTIAPPPRPQAADTRAVAARRDRHDRLRLQDPGEHGPEPSRPHRLHARVLGQAHARHEGEARAHRQADERSRRRSSSSPRTARIAEEAFAGDVVGIPNHGTLRIGDTLTEGEDIMFPGVPSFAPEILRRVRLEDAMKAKKLREALQQMAEEGVVQVFLPHDGSPAIVGVVGALQLDVLKERLCGRIRPADRLRARRASRSAAGSSAEERAELDRFIAAHDRGGMAARPRRRAGVHGALAVLAEVR